jgi:hypothetical protein
LTWKERIVNGEAMREATEATARLNETGWYVYGATKEIPACLTTLIAVEPERPVEAVPVEPFFAIASRVSLSDYDEPSLEARIGDVVWLEPRVRRHEAVNARIFDETAIIPMRFGTVFRSHESLGASFEARRGALTEAFLRLDGKAEWTLKISVAKDELARHAAATDEALRAACAAVAGLSPGAAFFQRKKLDALRESAVRDAKRRLADEAVAAFEASGWRIQRRDAVDAPEHPHATALVNAAVLGRRTDSERLVAVAESLIKGWESVEVQADVALDGPWPPFRFLATN